MQICSKIFDKTYSNFFLYLIFDKKKIITSRTAQILHFIFLFVLYITYNIMLMYIFNPYFFQICPDNHKKIFVETKICLHFAKQYSCTHKSQPLIIHYNTSQPMNDRMPLLRYVQRDRHIFFVISTHLCIYCINAYKRISYIKTNDAKIRKKNTAKLLLNFEPIFSQEIFLQCVAFFLFSFSL